MSRASADSGVAPPWPLDASSLAVLSTLPQSTSTARARPVRRSQSTSAASDIPLGACS